MTNIDQFESVFKAADKPVFHPQEIDLSRRVVVCDATGDAAETFRARCRRFLPDGDQVEWIVVSGDQFNSIGELLRLVTVHEPKVILTHRNLHVPAAEHPYSLGAYLDVLTQATDYPVLVAPQNEPDSFKTPTHVMALSDELVGENRLVSFSARLTGEGGTLFLSHIEDEAIFKRYIDAIGKIPSIDTDSARDLILERLLQDSSDYVESCREVLAKQNFVGKIEAVTQTGHRVELCLQLIEEDAIDLLVLNTKDEEQLAMHGLAYPLAVQLRKIPLLLL
jgi:hypothetical protein